ncbi:hypothetical protein [Dickeya fangzhongdai]|uniref:hypothetical protein n=1 Tax=Dickeya fangzhongdai TaxID=1778540 RepID=UPI0023E3D7EC|nr:hypothetical protein [Dickeya fangzhongdai]WES88545.1 hypothetical protein PQ617_20390 [Dickeya fangzhongdai]
MLKATRRYLRAAGSILDLMPATDYLADIGKKNDSERMASDFQAIGDDLRVAMNAYGRKKGIESGIAKR